MTSLHEILRGENYISLTTFRKNGQAVATPVWFSEADGKFYVWSEAHSGKIKRLHNNTSVLVSPSDSRGKVTGPVLPARARLLKQKEDAPKIEMAESASKKKYGWQLAFFRTLMKWRKKEYLYIEITPHNE